MHGVTGYGVYNMQILMWYGYKFIQPYLPNFNFGSINSASVTTFVGEDFLNYSIYIAFRRLQMGSTME